MNFKDLLERGVVEKFAPDAEQIQTLQERALKDLAAARTLGGGDPEWVYVISYEAMLRAGKCLLLARGYRPRGRDIPKAIITAMSSVGGEPLKALVNLMDLMRRRRAQALDEMNRPIPRYEGEQALEHAEKFVTHALRLARKSHTQLTLFR